MIRNARQYRITKAQVNKLERALRRLAGDRREVGSVHPLLRKAEVAALKSQLEELQTEIEEYEGLRSGKRRVFQLESFEELPRALIQARIAAGLSQEQLAARLKLKAQQIQRYEATDYASASLSRLAQVVRALGVKIRENVSLPRARAS